MVGLPNHQVIPPGWQDLHRPVAESTMTGIGYLTNPDGPPEWPSEVPTPGARLTVDIPCRIQRLQGDRSAEVVTQEVTTALYLVTLPLALVPDFDVTSDGPIFRLTGYKPGHEGDPHLIGRRLKVTSIQRGTLVWERDLTCLDDLTQGGA